MIWCILSIFFGILIAIILIPLKIELNYKINTNFEDKNDIEKIKLLNYLDIYILRVIKIKRINISQIQQVKDKNKIKLVFDTIFKLVLDAMNYKKFDEALLNRKDLMKINDSLFFEKVDLNIGINLKDVILNAYIISFLNMAINMYIAKNIEKFELENTSYNTYVSNSIVNLKIDSIINLKLTNTIFVIIKIIFRLRKVAKKNGRTTSNRKFDANSYDFT